MTRNRFALQIALCLLLLFPAAKAGAAETAEPAECKVVAKIYGQPVCEADLTDPMPGSMQEKDLPENMQHQVDAESIMRQRERLKAIIWKRALDKNLPDAHLKPSEEEVLEYRKLFNKAMETSYEADKKTITLLTDAYESDRFGPDAKKQIKDLLDTVGMSVYFYEERQKHRDETPGNFAFIAERAENQIATNMLSTWLLDKALFDKYGGRLLIREDNLWPADAYQAIFADIKGNGDLEITDPAFKGVMEEMEKGFDSLSYDELPQDDEMYGVYFTAPESPFGLGNNDSRLQMLKDWLASLEEKKD